MGDIAVVCACSVGSCLCVYCRKASPQEGFLEMLRRFSSEASFFFLPFRAIVSVSTTTNEKAQSERLRRQRDHVHRGILSQIQATALDVGPHAAALEFEGPDVPTEGPFAEKHATTRFSLSCCYFQTHRANAYGRRMAGTHQQKEFASTERDRINRKSSGVGDANVILSVGFERPVCEHEFRPAVIDDESHLLEAVLQPRRVGRVDRNSHELA